MTAPVPPNARPRKHLAVSLNEGGIGKIEINGQHIRGVVGLSITSRPRDLTHVVIELLGYEINADVANAEIGDLGIGDGRWTDHGPRE